MLKEIFTKVTLSPARSVVAATLPIIAGAFHRIPMILILFMAAVFLDYLTGTIKSKYFLHEWNSKTGLLGALKKVMYFVLIGTSFLVGESIKEVGNTVGLDLSFALFIGWYTVAILLINEYTSILENLYVIMPEKVPVWLVKTLLIADDELENKINAIVCKKQECDNCNLKERCNMRKDDEV